MSEFQIQHPRTVFIGIWCRKTCGVADRMEIACHDAVTGEHTRLACGFRRLAETNFANDSILYVNHVYAPGRRSGPGSTGRWPVGFGC
jgi:hypothetical protein